MFRFALPVFVVLVVFSRWYALLPYPINYDEYLFINGVVDYQVCLHRPHPPGYPVFVMAAKATSAIIAQPFRALQATSFLSSLFTVALFPWLLLPVFGWRDMRTWRATLLFAFFPVVWFYSGHVLSDSFALLLTVLQLGLLLRLRPLHDNEPPDAPSHANLWLALGLLTGMQLGVRPQNLVPMFPMYLWIGWFELRTNGPRGLLLCVATTVVTVSTWLWWMQFASGDSLATIWRCIHVQVDYLERTDLRTSHGLDYRLFRLFKNLGGRSFADQNVSIALGVFSVWGALSWWRTGRRGLAAVTLGGFWVAVLLIGLILDAGKVRYFLASLPLLAILSVEGISSMGQMLARRSARLKVVAPAVTALLVMVMVRDTYSALRSVRLQPEAHPSSLAEEVRMQYTPEETVIVVDSGLESAREFLFPGYEATTRRDLRQILRNRTKSYLVEFFINEQQPMLSSIDASQEFVLTRAFKRYARRYISWTGYRVVKLRNYKECVIDVGSEGAQELNLLAGFHAPQTEGSHSLRWTSGRAQLLLPPPRYGLLLRMSAIRPKPSQFPVEFIVSIQGKEVYRDEITSPDIREIDIPISLELSEELATMGDQVVVTIDSDVFMAPGGTWPEGQAGIALDWIISL